MKLTVTLPFRPDISKFLYRHGSRKTLALFLLIFFIQINSGCSRSSDVKSIEIEIWNNGSLLDCNAFESDEQVWSIKQFAFFISNVKLSNENNENQPKLSSTPWQTDDVALIQPHLAECSAKLNVESKIEQNEPVVPERLKTNNRLQFLTPVDLESLEQLSFTLAVPFELNHQNPLLQPSPLNLPTMFWSWRSGHKFFRLDLQSPSKNWVFHLGSVGCKATSTMRPAQGECLQPNRVSFYLGKKYNGTKLVMHLDRLIKNTSMQNNDSCLFHSGQQNCDILISNLKIQDVFEWH